MIFARSPRPAPIARAFLLFLYFFFIFLPFYAEKIKKIKKKRREMTRFEGRQVCNSLFLLLVMTVNVLTVYDTDNTSLYF